MMTTFDHIVHDPRFMPYWGWHDDQRDGDGTPDYRPAAQQVRQEFLDFAEALRDLVLVRHPLKVGRSCLQLGLGVPGATHMLFSAIFDEVRSVERDRGTVDQFLHRFPDVRGGIIHGDTNSAATYQLCASFPPWDMLFIDAGHRYEEVLLDHTMYSSLVRPGGIVAFHDAVHRPQFGDGIGVWRLLAELRGDGFDVQTIGDEVGIAYYVVP